jgi:glyoxylase-like metal-dependent hydrolase (beta-lactamase superfamily II)
MPQEIITINLPLPFKVESVNCYLVKTDSGYILIEAGSSNQRGKLEKKLEEAGCQPGNLRLIVITHGDIDHTGNAVYLRHKFATKVAMHPAESKAAESGNMLLSRKSRSLLSRMLFSVIRLRKSDRFTPDVYVGDGDDLSAFGCDAKVIHIPGHTNGSIGILTAAGDLFCGDLFVNHIPPKLNRLIDDRAAAHASVEKLKGLEIKTVYPGHGEPFPMDLFIKNIGE